MADLLEALFCRITVTLLPAIMFFAFASEAADDSATDRTVPRLEIQLAHAHSIKRVAQFIAVCSASTLAEKRLPSSL
jgi:hypothetical protein